ncbi:hypothetical protein CEJ89_15135 [Staphylococcus aureus]|nr:hypothetical protein CEJ89_15135 [Staphylococcus aureus]
MVEVPGGNGFRAAAESFARMVRLGPWHRDGATEAASVDTAPALQAIAASARNGAWVEVGAPDDSWSPPRVVSGECRCSAEAV